MGFGPSEADILAIKAKTDNLPTDPASNTQVATRAAPGAQMALTVAEETAVQGKILSDATPFPGANVPAIKANTDLVPNMIFTLDLWSTYAAQVQLTTVGGDKALPSITIANLPIGAIIKQALMFFKCRTVENTNAAVNSVSGAQNIQCQKAVGGAYITGIALSGGEFSVPASTRENGDVMMGTTDVSAQVPANGAVMSFKWTSAVSAQNNLNFNDVQIGIRIYYTVA